MRSHRLQRTLALWRQQPQPLPLLPVVTSSGFVQGWRPSVGLQGTHATAGVDNQTQPQQIQPWAG